MDDEAHVRLVDSHAEGDGGHNYVHLLGEEFVLVVGTGFGIQSRVVGERLDAVDFQQGSHLLHLLPAQAVDDAGPSRILLDIPDDVLLGFDLVAHLVKQVGPVERRLEHPRIRNGEVFHDIALHLRGGRGGEGDDGRVTDLVDEVADPPVFRTEIVSPFRDTVGLIYRIERNLDFLEQLDVLLLGEGLGRHVQQFGGAGQQVGLDFGHLGAAQRGIQEMCDALVAGYETADGIHLVLHQGDERGDDDGRPFHDQGRQLVA